MSLNREKSDREKWVISKMGLCGFHLLLRMSSTVSRGEGEGVVSIRDIEC